MGLRNPLRIAKALYCEDDVNTYNFNSVVPLSVSLFRSERALHIHVYPHIVYSIRSKQKVCLFCYCWSCRSFTFYSIFYLMLLFLFFRFRTFHVALSFWCLFHREWCMCAQFPSLVILTTYCQLLGMPWSFSHFF